MRQREHAASAAKAEVVRKSAGSNPVGVQVPPPAPIFKVTFSHFTNEFSMKKIKRPKLPKWYKAKFSFEASSDEAARKKVLKLVKNRKDFKLIKVQKIRDKSLRTYYVLHLNILSLSKKGMPLNQCRDVCLVIKGNLREVRKIVVPKPVSPVIASKPQIKATHAPLKRTPFVVPDVEKISFDDSVSLLRNIIGILCDPDKSYMHQEARRVKDSIYKVWVKKFGGINDNNGYFKWPSTMADYGNGKLSQNGWEIEGVLSFFGYRVGHTQGKSMAVRQAILTEVFLGVIPPVFSRFYLSEWRSSKSAGRLRKMAETLASLTRNAKRKKNSDMSLSISQWEEDLSFLFRKFYIPMFRNKFTFPDSEVA